MYRITERRGLTTDASGRTSLAKGAIAAGLGGALGSIAGTPFFLVKTRLQAQAARAIAVGHQHKYGGTFNALGHIFKREGIKGNYCFVKINVFLSENFSQYVGSSVPTVS